MKEHATQVGWLPVGSLGTLGQLSAGLGGPILQLLGLLAVMEACLALHLVLSETLRGYEFRFRANNLYHSIPAPTNPLL
jgi:hypothetical protein